MSRLLYFIFNLYANLIFIYVILSWMPGARERRFGQMITNLVEPYLMVIRSVLPKTGMLDFSPIIGYILIELALVGIVSFF